MCVHGVAYLVLEGRRLGRESVGHACPGRLLLLVEAGRGLDGRERAQRVVGGGERGRERRAHERGVAVALLALNCEQTGRVSTVHQYEAALRALCALCGDACLYAAPSHHRVQRSLNPMISPATTVLLPPASVAAKGLVPLLVSSSLVVVELATLVSRGDCNSGATCQGTIGRSTTMRAGHLSIE